MISDLLKQAESDEGGYDDEDEDGSGCGGNGNEDRPYLESYYPADEDDTQQMISKIIPSYNCGGGSNGTGTNNLSGFASV
jgi:hypothetical protein